MSPGVLATAHIVGAVLAYFVLSGVLLFLWGMWQERIKKNLYEEMSGKFGISPLEVEMEDEAHSPRMMIYFSERASSEFLRNRLADLCGVLGVVWNVLTTLFVLAWFVGVVWYTTTEDLRVAVYGWWLLAFSVVFTVIGAAFWFSCKLLLGRYPGEPKRIRKNLAAVIERRGRAPSSDR